MKKQITYSILALVVLFGGLFGVYKLIGSNSVDADTAKKLVERIPSRTMWNKNAPHTLTVFSDFECPACKAFDDYLQTFEATNSPQLPITKKTALVFRYFPLYQIHQYAYSLAYAAEAAARQGKFAEITKRFFADQTKFETMTDIKPYLVTVAKDLSLNAAQFQKDMDDPKIQQVVQDELQLGESAGVNATPTFFLDGQKLENLAPLDLLNALKKL